MPVGQQRKPVSENDLQYEEKAACTPACTEADDDPQLTAIVAAWQCL